MAPAPGGPTLRVTRQLARAPITVQHAGELLVICLIQLSGSVRRIIPSCNMLGKSPGACTGD